MKKNKGFTLIELLAIIVILAIIAVITVPIILNVIDNAKRGVAETSAQGYLKAVEKQLVMNNVDRTKDPVTDGTYNITELKNMGVQVSGKEPKEGSVTIKNGKIDACTLVINEYTVTCLENGKVTSEIFNDTLTHNNIVYSWSGEYYDNFLKEETFKIMKDLNITTVYHSFNDLYINEEENIADNLLNEGYEVYHLIGASDWYNKFDEIKIQIDNVYNYNIRKNKKIKGLVLDVEFYVLNEYQTNPNNVIESLINTYNQVLTYAHNKNLKVIFCLPSWLDTEYPSQLEELIKISDGVSIMNYNQSVVFEGITKEVELAKKYNKSISNITEFDNLDEKYVTYYDEGLDKALEDWKKLEQQYNYSKLNFAFHHLNSLLELKNGHKVYNYIVKDANSNILQSERVYITVKHNNEVINFKRNSNSEGKVSITLPNDSSYQVQISLQNYDIQNINNKNSTQNISNNEIIIGQRKEQYTIELYFHTIDNDGNISDFKNKKVVVYSKDKGEIFVRTTSDTYGHIAVNLTYDENYYIEVFDGNDYTISINNENMNSNITNEFIHTKTDGSYLSGDVYIKTK